MKACLICRVAALISAIGAINWLAQALYNIDFVKMIFGQSAFSTRIIYGLIAGMGFILLLSVLGVCTACKRMNEVEN